MRTARPLLTALVLGACGPQVASIDVEPAEVRLTARGATAALKGVARNSRGEPIPGMVLAWSSTDPDVATVDPHGVVTAVGPGDAEVVAGYKARLQGRASIVVSLPHALLVSPDRVVLGGIGESAELKARVVDSKGREIPDAEIRWEVENPEVVSVNRNRFTAVGVGDARVFATYGDLQAPASIRVEEPRVASLEIAPATLDARVGRELKLSVTARNEAGEVVPGAKIHYAVEDAAIATVDDTGVLTPVKPGRTRVIVRSGGAEKRVDLLVRR
ncbi:MAG: Ig domain-containing protein [Myxococcales bacterium]